MSRENRNRPVQEFRLGKVRAAVWENQSQKGLWHSVTVSRRYKDGNTWKDSNSFFPEDLPLLAKSLDIAHTWIYNNTAPPPPGDENRDG